MSEENESDLPPEGGPERVIEIDPSSEEGQRILAELFGASLGSSAKRPVEQDQYAYGYGTYLHHIGSHHPDVEGEALDAEVLRASRILRMNDIASLVNGVLAQLAPGARYLLAYQYEDDTDHPRVLTNIDDGAAIADAFRELALRSALDAHGRESVEQSGMFKLQEVRDLLGARQAEVDAELADILDDGQSNGDDF